MLEGTRKFFKEHLSRRKAVLSATLVGAIASIFLFKIPEITYEVYVNRKTAIVQVLYASFSDRLGQEISINTTKDVNPKNDYCYYGINEKIPDHTVLIWKKVGDGEPILTTSTQGSTIYIKEPCH